MGAAPGRSPRRLRRRSTPAEEKLVTALAVAMWKEIRADRREAEVLAAIPPLAPGRPCGGDLQQPAARAVLDHRPALHHRRRHGGPAPAQRAFLAHRKARGAGAARGRQPGLTPCPPTKTARTICPGRGAPAPVVGGPGAAPAGGGEAGQGQGARRTRPARGGGARRRRVAGRAAGGRGGPRARGPAAGEADAGGAQGGPPHHRPRPARRHRALPGGRRPRGLRGVVRPPAPSRPRWRWGS